MNNKQTWPAGFPRNPQHLQPTLFTLDSHKSMCTNDDFAFPQQSAPRSERQDNDQCRGPMLWQSGYQRNDIIAIPKLLSDPPQPHKNTMMKIIPNSLKPCVEKIIIKEQEGRKEGTPQNRSPISDSFAIKIPSASAASLHLYSLQEDLNPGKAFIHEETQH